MAATYETPERDTLIATVLANDVVPTFRTGARYYVTSVSAGTLEVSDDGTNFDAAGDLPDFTATAYRFVRITADGIIYMRAI